jgi:hypothetical protein
MHSVCTEEEFCERWERIDNLKWKKVLLVTFTPAPCFCAERGATETFPASSPLTGIRPYVSRHAWL